MSWDGQSSFITHTEKCMKSMSETKNYVWLQKYWIPLSKSQKKSHKRHHGKEARKPLVTPSTTSIIIKNALYHDWLMIVLKLGIKEVSE